jgi:hypothetical protein
MPLAAFLSCACRAMRSVGDRAQSALGGTVRRVICRRFASVPDEWSSGGPDARIVEDLAPATSGEQPRVPERWLTKRELAAHLAMCLRWVELRQAEGLPSRLIGRRRRYRLADVERWLIHREAERAKLREVRPTDRSGRGRFDSPLPGSRGTEGETGRAETAAQQGFSRPLNLSPRLFSGLRSSAPRRWTTTFSSSPIHPESRAQAITVTGPA